MPRLEDANISWSYPAKVIDATVINLNSLAQPIDIEFNFCNKYLSEIRLNISVDSIEYGLLLLTQLKSLFPSIAFVKIVYLYGIPTRKKLLVPLKDERLRKFALNLKKDLVGVEEFSNMLNEFVFEAYPVVHFEVNVIYQPGSLMSQQLVS